MGLPDVIGRGGRTSVVIGFPYRQQNMIKQRYGRPGVLRKKIREIYGYVVIPRNLDIIQLERTPE